ncbi:Membrane-bound lytic murein transglycosylase C precursor [compost metagenome]
MLDVRRFFGGKVELEKRGNYYLFVRDTRDDAVELANGINAYLNTLKLQKRAMFFIGMSSCAFSMATDVYKSENADGAISFSSQKNDATYSIYLKGESNASLSTIRRTYLKKNNGEDEYVLNGLIQKYSEKHGVDAALIRAVIEVESQFNVHAVSSKGAIGLMQLMPATAQRYGVKDTKDPAQNIEGGVKYMKDLLALHKGNIALALASYNAGEGSVFKYGRRIPPYKETMLYVPAVMTKMEANRNRSYP